MKSGMTFPSFFLFVGRVRFGTIITKPGLILYFFVGGFGFRLNNDFFVVGFGFGNK